MQVIMKLEGGGQAAICVLPMGAGKSILFMFMLPAMIRDAGTSVVAVPFSALMDDLVTWGRAMGVDCIKFKISMSAGRDSLPRAARLVVASADAISGAEGSGSPGRWWFRSSYMTDSGRGKRRARTL
jgi:superfamily II DNA helicase RecQ